MYRISIALIFAIGPIMFSGLSVASGQGVDSSIVQRESAVERLYADREKEWEPALREAGQVKHGIALVTRVGPVSATSLEDADLVVSIKNLSNRPIYLLPSDRAWPNVMIRAEVGKLVKYTSEGMSNYWNLQTGGRQALVLGPGCAQGIVVPLWQYFNLARAGKYTVLAEGVVIAAVIPESVLVGRGQTAPKAQEGSRNKSTPGASSPVAPPWAVDERPWVYMDWDKFVKTLGVHSEAVKPRLVSQPLVFEIPKYAPPGNGAPPPTNPALWNEKEWAAAEATAGRFHEGCLLEVCPVRNAPDSIDLIASHTYLRRHTSVDMYPSGIPGVYAGNYRIAVRDPNGKLLPMTALGRKTTASRHFDPNSTVFCGDALGAVIPLTQFFDMKMPGEYTVLVALPSPEETDTMCVAKPLKVRIDKPTPRPNK